MTETTVQVPKYKVRVEIVSIDVEVLDDNGDPVRDLSQQDFLVKENGREEKIVNFSYLHDASVSLAFVLDTSTIEQEKLNRAKEFLVDIMHLLDRKDDMCIFSFDGRDSYLEAAYTTDRPVLMNSIDSIAVSSKRKWGFLSEFFGADPATSLAIDEAIESHRESAHPRKILLLISNRFRGLGPVTVDHIQDSRCILYTLGFDNKSAAIMGYGDQITKRQLMRESGGRRFSAETGNVMAVSKEIVSSMKNYYSIGFQSEAATENEEERRIEVRIPGRDYTINTRRTIIK